MVTREEANWAAADFAWVTFNAPYNASNRFCFMAGYVQALNEEEEGKRAWSRAE